MPDEIDQIQENVSLLDNLSIKQVRANAAKIPSGEPGECCSCGEFFKRVVRGLCGRCRDDLAKEKTRRYG